MLNDEVYLVHGRSVILRQDNVHGVHAAAEGDCAGVLAVLLITQDLCSLLGFLHVKRANGDPAQALEPLQVSFVHSL